MNVTGDVIEEFTGNHSSQVTQNLYLKGMQVVIEGLDGTHSQGGTEFHHARSQWHRDLGRPPGADQQRGSGADGISRLTGLAAFANRSGRRGRRPGRLQDDTRRRARRSNSTLALQNISPAKKSSSSDAPSHDPDSPDNKDKKHYIEIELHDDDGNPVPGEPYKITLPDGSVVASGTTDAKGYAKVNNIDPGTCKVTFPNLDKDAWKPA